MISPHGTAETHALVLPTHANHHQTLFAGQALRWLAEAAFLAARSLAQRDVVMAAVSGVDFRVPVPVGHSLMLRAHVSRVGRSSMTVCVRGYCQAPGAPTDEALQAVFEMVAVDAAGRPHPLEPHLQPHQETP
jgi:acyl-CoA thioesterase YciA